MSKFKVGDYVKLVPWVCERWGIRNKVYQIDEIDGTNIDSKGTVYPYIIHELPIDLNDYDIIPEEVYTSPLYKAMEEDLE